jgi:surface protein
MVQRNHPGNWQNFSKRNDNQKLSINELTSKYKKELLLFENFVTFQMQQQAFLRQQSSGGGFSKVFTSTVQLQKAMVQWYTNQESAELRYGIIEEWDVSNVTSFAFVVGGENPFYDFSANYQTTFSQFNRDLSGWNVSNGTDFQFMFFECQAYNNAGVSLSGWDVSKSTNFNGMFTQASNFVGVGVDSWNVSNATNIAFMFSGCELFNININGWDTSNVTNMSGVFETTPAYNQPLNNWDVSKVTTMSEMFNCQIDGGIFNQPLSSWDTSNVTDMSFMFNGAESFNQDISNFDFSSVVPNERFGTFYSAQRFLGIVSGGIDTSTAMSVANYSTLLISMSSQTLNANVLFDAGDTQYSAGAAATARATIVSTPWTVTDGGQA